VITNILFTEQAKSSQYDKLTYSDCDCQAFVEKVLYDSGVRKPNGGAYNWKGSNDMWRNALDWRGSVEDCISIYGKVPDGAWVFILKYDGGEKDRGYNDGEGNAKHVGIYVGNDQVRDSTRSTKPKRDGVGYRPLSDFNMVGICKYLDYESNNKDNTHDKIISLINSIRAELDRIERMV
jgi:hypothetical protein